MAHSFTPTKKPIAACIWAAALLAVCFCVAAVASAVAPNAAYAEVRKADLIMGDTVENRQLTVSQCPDIEAQYAYVVDEDGTVYFERDADEETQIASITKVMTAIVAIENGDLEDEITVSEKAAEIGESSAELQEGDTLTLEQALRALMVPSGNDAAEALAEFYGHQMLEAEGDDTTNWNETAARFVEAMNEKAAEIGMENTVFTNPHGLDYDVYEGELHSTARDVAKMVAYAMQDSTFREVVALGDTTIKVNRDGSKAGIELEPTDELIGNYDGACGVKTGYTELAGNCFAAACNRDDKDLYAIVLNSSDETQRFNDAETLFDWVYDHTVDVPIANSSEECTMEVDGETQTVPVIAEAAYPGWVDATFKVTLADKDASVQVFDLNGNVSQTVQMDSLGGDIHVGDKVGTLNLYQRNELVASVELVAAEEQRGPNIFEQIGVFFDRLISGRTQASDILYNELPLLNDKTS